MTPWVDMLIEEYQWLYVVYLEWMRLLAARPVPGHVSAPLGPQAQGPAWTMTLHALLDSASEADSDAGRAALARAEAFGFKEQVNLAYALAVRARLVADACGGRERLAEITALGWSRRPARRAGCRVRPGSPRAARR